MPFFEIQENSLRLVKLSNFNVEKELQTLIEQNLEVTRSVNASKPFPLANVVGLSEAP